MITGPSSGCALSADAAAQYYKIVIVIVIVIVRVIVIVIVIVKGVRSR